LEATVLELSRWPAELAEDAEDQEAEGEEAEAAAGEAPERRPSDGPPSTRSPDEICRRQGDPGGEPPGGATPGPPLPRVRRAGPNPELRPFAREGARNPAANVRAAEGGSLEWLNAMPQQDLMTEVTAAAYWQEEGLTQRIAEALGQARIRDRDELAAMTREELLSLANLPEGAVRRCEELLGHPLPSAVDYWTGHGLPRVLAWRLSRHRVMTLEDFRRLTPAGVRRLGFQSHESDLVSRVLPDL